MVKLSPKTRRRGKYFNRKRLLATKHALGETDEKRLVFLELLKQTGVAHVDKQGLEVEEDVRDFQNFNDVIHVRSLVGSESDRYAFYQILFLPVP